MGFSSGFHIVVHNKWAPSGNFQVGIPSGSQVGIPSGSQVGFPSGFPKWDFQVGPKWDFQVGPQVCFMFPSGLSQVVFI